MKIYLKKLCIKNFLSLGDVELDLDKKGFTLINGINNNTIDSAKSNGAGKSSIIESIIWNLTGETSRGTKDVVNKFSTDGTRVELSFDIDNNHYRLIRCKEDKEFGTNLFLYINGENKSGKGIRDTQQILENYLPDITSELLGSVIILGQGLPQRFTNNTPSGRKEILEKLSKSDFMIMDIKDKLAKRKSILNDEIRTFEDTLLSLNTKKSMKEQELQKLKEDKALLIPSDAYDTDINKNIEYLDSLNSTKFKLDVKYNEYKDKLDAKLKEYQDWTSKVNANYLHECTYLEEYYNITDLKNNLTKLETEIKLKKDNIIKLDSIVDICPTCGQHLPDVHKVDTSVIKAELEELQNKYISDKNYFNNLSAEIENKKKSILEQLNKDTEEIKNQGKSLRNVLNDIESELKECNTQINNITLTLDKLKLNKENNEKLAKTIDSDINTCEDLIKQFSEEILYNNIAKDNKNKHLDIVTKMLTIATRDFRGYLLSGIIDYISLKAKEYCREIFDTDMIDFKLDGNNIFIGYNGKSYENLSGGEKQKVDLIVQFSIRDMLNQFLDFRCNVLCLDEIFDNLDSFGCTKVLNLITNKLTDIESLFIITHHQDLDIPYDNEIVIIKNEKGISELQ